MINNGKRKHLVIVGVFDGMAGVQGSTLAFVPNMKGNRPESIKGGVLDGEPVMLTITKDAAGPLYRARFKDLA